jgi:hypothetical protein
MKQWQLKVVVILMGIFLGLVMAEAGVRFFGIEYPRFYDYDPHLGHTLRPGIKGYYLKEGGGHVAINSDGLGDREHAIKKPANTDGVWKEAWKVTEEVLVQIRDEVVQKGARLLWSLPVWHSSASRCLYAE